MQVQLNAGPTSDLPQGNSRPRTYLTYEGRTSPSPHWRQPVVSFLPHRHRQCSIPCHLEDPDHEDLHQSNHSEYNAISIATEHIKFYRTYLAWLDIHRRTLPPLETDCAPAFRIFTAPHFPKNSKNLLVQNPPRAYHDKIPTPYHDKIPTSMLSPPDPRT